MEKLKPTASSSARNSLSYKDMVASIDEKSVKLLYEAAMKEQKKSGGDIKNEKISMPGTDGYL